MMANDYVLDNFHANHSVATMWSLSLRVNNLTRYKIYENNLFDNNPRIESINVFTADC